MGPDPFGCFMVEVPESILFVSRRVVEGGTSAAFTGCNSSVGFRLLVLSEA